MAPPGQPSHKPSFGAQQRLRSASAHRGFRFHTRWITVFSYCRLSLKLFTVDYEVQVPVMPSLETSRGARESTFWDFGIFFFETLRRPLCQLLRQGQFSPTLRRPWLTVAAAANREQLIWSDLVPSGAGLRRTFPRS